MEQGYTAPFDYGEMARQAAKERDALRLRLQLRKERRPASPEEVLRWKRENSVLYDMYLEQRHNHLLFSARAAQRAAAREETA